MASAALEARSDREAARLTLAANAGFTATGILAEKAEASPDSRRQHRTIAMTSMAVATASQSYPTTYNAGAGTLTIG